MAGKQEDLEVTGVSRSGRVRKKSSKLLDFESPEEAEARLKKLTTANVGAKSTKSKAKQPAVPPLRLNIPKKLQQQPQPQESFEMSYSDGDSSDYPGLLENDEFYDDYENSIELGSEETLDKDISSSMKSEPSDEDEALEESLSDYESEFADGGASSKDGQMTGPVQSSLYLMEKSKKKMMMKDGKLVVGRHKTQRKDKGKTRFTAYMLWAKEMRPIVSRQNPDMDFVRVSKRLGELWSNVSKSERVTWRRRAMRMANKVSGGMITTGAAKDTGNKPGSTSSPKRSTATQRGGSKVAAATPRQQRQRILSASDGLESFTGLDSLDNITSLPSPPAGQSSARVGETEPLDVAAHLHLLGESLTVIGARLKEHEGQIAVSGSLSVLLDSVLCALGPLMCLTRLTPETDGCPPEVLHRILDNIAYIMPGL